MVLLKYEHTEDRLAALHRDGLELVSKLSLKSVLERIVELARELAGARYAVLGVINQRGELDQFIPIGMTQQQIEYLDHPDLGNDLFGILNAERRTIRVSFIDEDTHHLRFPFDHSLIKSFLGIPILQGDQLLGQIYLIDKLDYHEFTEQDEIVLEILATYIAVAISNERLFAQLDHRDIELSQHNEDQNFLNQVAFDLTSVLDIEEILSKTLDHLMTYLDVEVGEIFLCEDGEQELRLSLHRGDFPNPLTQKDRFRLGEGFIGRSASTRLLIHSNNLAEKMHFLHPDVLEAGFHNIAYVPLIAKEKVVGVMITANRREYIFNEREQNLLTGIGTRAGSMIENVRLNRQARRLAVLEERERIGMDMHDGVIQSIYGVGLALEYIRVALEEDPKVAQDKINESIDTLNETIRNIRAYILDLRPRQFHGEGLLQGLKRLIVEFQTYCVTRVNLVAPDDGLLDIPAANSTTLFHICQESLANVAKHSNAKQTEVHLWIAKERLLLEVSDDGEGFDLQKINVTLGHGLSNMQARARKVGGDIEITSTHGNGTTVLAWVPRYTI